MLLTLPKLAPFEFVYCEFLKEVDEKETLYDRPLEDLPHADFIEVSSEKEKDWMRFYIDGQLSRAISGEQDWVKVYEEISEGKHILRWEYSKDAAISTGRDAGWIDEVKLTDFRETVFDFENATLSGFENTGPNDTWYITKDPNDSYSYMARSSLNVDGWAYMDKIVYFPEPTQISFDWKGGMYNHLPSNKLQFYIDDTLKITKTGSFDWETLTYTVPAGNHRLRWATWRHYHSGNAYVDNISIPIENTVSYDGFAPREREIYFDGELTDYNDLEERLMTVLYDTDTGLKVVSQDIEDGEFSSGKIWFESSEMDAYASVSGILSEVNIAQNLLTIGEQNVALAGDIYLDGEVVSPETLSSEFAASSAGGFDIRTLSTLRGEYMPDGSIMSEGDISLYRVRSFDAGDAYRFYVNNELISEITGNADWTKVEYPLTDGTYTVRWEYTKSAEPLSVDDTAWLDNVQVVAGDHTDAYSFTPEGQADLPEITLGGIDVQLSSLEDLDCELESELKMQTIDGVWRVLTELETINFTAPQEVENVSISNEVMTVDLEALNIDIIDQDVLFFSS